MSKYKEQYQKQRLELEHIIDVKRTEECISYPDYCDYLEDYSDWLEKRLEGAEGERERLKEYCKTNAKQQREELPPIGVVPPQTYIKGFDVGYNLATCHTYEEIIDVMNKEQAPAPGTETPDPNEEDF